MVRSKGDKGTTSDDAPETPPVEGQDEFTAALDEARGSPGDEGAWDRLEEVATEQQRPDEVAALYKEVLSRDLPPVLASTLGQRGIQFLEEWFGESSPELLDLLSRVVALSPGSDWAFQRLTIAHTVAGRWNDLLEVYDKAIAAAIEPERRISLLSEAANVARDFAQYPDRAIGYLEQLVGLKPGDEELSDSLERLLERQERWQDLIAFWSRGLDEMPRIEAHKMRARIAECYLDRLGQAQAALEQACHLLDEEGDGDVALGLLERIAGLEDAPVEVRQAALGALKEHYDSLERVADVVRTLEAALTLATRDQSVALHKEVGERLMEQGRDGEAVEHFAALLRLEPTAVDALVNLRALAERTGDSGAFVAALEAAADSCQTVETRAALRLEAARTRSTKLDDGEGAIALYRQVLEEPEAEVPALLEACRRLGDLYEAAEQLEEQLAVLERLATLEPEEAVRRAVIGRAARLADTLDQTERALGLWQGRIESAADDVEALDAMVAILAREESWQPLIDALRQRINGPVPELQRRADLIWIAGIQEDQLEEQDAAIATWREVEERFGQDSEVVDALARLLSATGRWEDLATLLESATVRESSHVADMLVWLGDAFRGELGQPRRALEFYLRAQRVVPEHEGMLEGLKALIEVDECRAEAAETLADAHEAVDRWEAVLELLEPRLESATSDVAKVSLLRQAAKLYETRGDNQAKALECLGRATALASDDEVLEAEMLRLSEATDTWSVAVEASHEAAEASEDEARQRHLLFQEAALAEARLNDDAVALEAYTRVLERAPERGEAAEGVVRTAGRQQMWDRVARSFVVHSMASGEVRAALIELIERIAEEADGLSALSAAIDEALEAAGDMPPEVGRKIDTMLARWYESKLDDSAGAERMLRRAAGREGDDLEVLRWLAQFQRQAPGRELYDTLIRIADQVLIEDNLDPLDEAAKLALDPIGDLDLAVETLERLFREASRLWRGSGQGAGEVSPEAATRWAMEELVRIHEERGEHEAAVALLGKGAELPLEPEHWREQRKRAARIAAGPLGDRGRAIVLYRSVLDENPEDTAALGALGDVVEAEGRLPELLALRQQELGAGPEPERALVIRLDIARIVGELEARGGRLEALKANLDQQPGHPASIEALIDMLEGARRYEDLADLLDQQANRLAEAEQGERAAALWAKVAQLSEERLDEPERAIRAYSLVAEQTGSLEALDALARLHEEREEFGAAARWLTRRLQVTEGEERVGIAMRLANARLTAGQVDKAIVRLRDVYAEQPRAAEVRDLLARLYRENEDWESLAELLTGAAQYVDDTDTLLEFAREGASIYGRLGSPDKAIEVLQRAAEAVPKDREIRKKLADGLTAAGRLDESEAILRELIEFFGRRRNAERAALHHELARVKKGQGDLDAALDELEQASSMAVGDTRVMGMLAELSREAGQHDRAERTYRALLMVVRRQPPEGEDAMGEAEVLYELHRLANERDQDDQAEELLRLALKAVSQSAEETARFRRAMLEREEHSLLLAALEQRAEALDGGAELAKVLDAQAEVLERLDRADEAFARRLKALEEAPDAWDIHDNTRVLAAKIGQPSQYIDALRDRIDRSRRRSDAELVSELLMRLGTILEEDVNDLEGAGEAFSKMEEWGERAAEARVAMARVARLRGDVVEAIRLFEKVVGDEEAPEDERIDARFRLAQMQLKDDTRIEAGREALEAALEIQPDWERAGGILREVTSERPDNDELLRLYERVARSAEESHFLLDSLIKRSARDDVTLAEVREAVNVATEQGEDEQIEPLLLRAAEVAEASEEGLGAAPWVSSGLAQRRRAAGDLAGALEWFRRAADATPDPERATDLRIEAAELAVEAGDLNAAAEIYEELLKPNPSDRRVWLPLLEVLAKAGDEERMLAQINATLESLVDPAAQNEVRLIFAKYLFGQPGREEDAVGVLRTILAEDRGHHEAYSLLVDLFERTNNNEELAELLNTQLSEAYERDDHELIHDVSLRMGKLLEDVRREDAMALYRRALKVLPHDRELAQALLGLLGPDDDPRERVDLLERPLASEEGEAAAELALELAREWAALDDDASVLRVLRRGYEAYPDDERVLEQLDRWYRDHAEWSQLADLLAAEAARREDPVKSVELLRSAASIRLESLEDPSGAAGALAAARTYRSDDLDLLAELARLRAQAGEYGTAIEEVGAALEAMDEDDSNRVALLRMKAELLTAVGRTEEAVADLDAAYQINPSEVEEQLIASLDAHRQALAERGDTEAERGVTLRLIEVLRGRGDTEVARNLLFQWLERAPEDLEALYMLREFEQAAEHLEGVAQVNARLVDLEKGEEQVNAVLQLADAYTQLEQPEAAQASLEAVFKSQPEATAVRDRLWALYEQIGATAKLAELLVLDAIKVEEMEERFALLRRAGDLYLQTEGGAAMAVEPLEEAFRLKPDDHDTLIALIDAYIGGGFLQEAQQLLEQAIAAVGNRRGPKPAGLQHRMARLAAAAGDRETQLQWLNVALDSNKRDGDVAAEAAELAMELGDYEAALKALRVVTVSRRESPMSLAKAFYYQAKIAHFKDEDRQAQMWARRALSEDKDYQEAIDFLNELESA